MTSALASLCEASLRQVCGGKQLNSYELVQEGYRRGGNCPEFVFKSQEDTRRAAGAADPLGGEKYSVVADAVAPALGEYALKTCTPEFQ